MLNCDVWTHERILATPWMVLADKLNKIGGRRMNEKLTKLIRDLRDGCKEGWIINPSKRAQNRAEKLLDAIIAEIDKEAHND